MVEPIMNSIQLNDITLWTGVPVNPNEGGDAFKWIPKIRERRCLKRITKTADSLQHYVQGHNSESHQPAGDDQYQRLQPGPVYRIITRELDLSTTPWLLFITGATASRLHQEYFASHPDRMIAIKLECLPEEIHQQRHLPHFPHSPSGESI